MRMAANAMPKNRGIVLARRSLPPRSDNAPAFTLAIAARIAAPARSVGIQSHDSRPRTLPGIPPGRASCVIVIAISSVTFAPPPAPRRLVHEVVATWLLGLWG